MAAILAVGGAAYYLLRYWDIEQKAESHVDAPTNGSGGRIYHFAKDADIINPREGDGHIEPYRTYWWQSGDTIYEPHASEGRWIRNSFADRKKWDTVRNRYNMEFMSYRHPGEKWGLRPENFPHNDL